MPKTSHSVAFDRWVRRVVGTADDTKFSAYLEGIRIERERWKSKIRCPSCSAYHAENCPRCHGEGIVTRRRSERTSGAVE